MKKILLSVGTIVVVAALAVGGTLAFYNDTETSTGNIFTAGSIDLKVDHLAQTYNGVDCKTCDVTLVSDTSNTVIEKNGVPLTSYPAVSAWVHPAWTARNDPELAASNAQWIWEQNPTKQEDTTVDTSYSFKKEFTWMGPIQSTDLFMAVGSDNGVQVYLNNELIGSNTGEFGYLQGSMLHILATNITPNIIQGNNVLKFVVTNMALPNGNPQNNPAGLIYKFHIDGNCGNAYFQNKCSLWQEKDLGSNDSFFNFDDVKPGDFGTDVISMHVDSNDAYACMLPINKHDYENACNNAEDKAGDIGASCGDPGDGLGELGTQIQVIAWQDNGDGIHQLGETILYQGSLKDELTEKLTISAGGTEDIGHAWCAGTISVDPITGSITCSASGMDNKAQTDSFLADLELYAVQQRNNTDFTCASVPQPVN